RPLIYPLAVAPVVTVIAGVLLSRPQGATSPGIDALAFLAVLDEGSFVAVARGPGLHSGPVLAPRFEFPLVLRHAGCLALAFRQSVLAAAGIASLQFRVED